MDDILAVLVELRTPVLYLVITAVVFAETAALLGMVVPGETAAVLAGVLASQQQLALELVIPLVVTAAVVGDSCGFTVARRFGPRLLSGRLLRSRRHRIDQARSALRRRGVPMVIICRFIPFARTATPAAAGISGLGYPRFVAASVAGGLLWGVACPVVGYLAADSYERVEAILGRGGAIVLVALVALGLAAHLVRRRRGAAPLPSTDAGPVTADTGLTETDAGPAAMAVPAEAVPTPAELRCEPPAR